MGRRATGTPVWTCEGWKVRITLADKSRPYVRLGADIGEHEVERARAKARELSEVARRRNVVLEPCAAPGPLETLEAYCGRLIEQRSREGLTSVKNDRGYVKNHLPRALAARPVADVARGELEDLVADLDRRALDGDMAESTGQNVWAFVRAVFRDACGHKVRALRVRKDNPAQGIAPPDSGAEKLKAYLYPSELLALLSCAEIPLDWRRLCALAVYLGARASELARLRWEDVDLERNTVHIHRAWDAEHGCEKPTKGMAARRVPIEPTLRPLLVAMKREAGAREFVAPLLTTDDGDTDVTGLAARLRETLLAAGVKRADLFANDDTRKNVTFHDLRSSYITWLAVAGVDALKIQRRAGHQDLKTTQGYIREAEVFTTEDFGRVFPPLPADLAGESSGISSVPGASAAEGVETAEENVVGHSGLETEPGRANRALSAPTQAFSNPPDPPNGPVGRVADDSRTIENPRGALVAHLAAAVGACSAVGDLEAARVALDALNRLLGSDVPAGAAPVVDLAAERRKGGR